MVGSGGIDGEGSCALFAIKISKRSCLSCPNWWSSAFQHSQRKPPPRAFHDDLLCQLWTNNRWLSAKRGLTYLENLLLICYWTALFQSTSNCLKSLSIFEILWVPFNIKFNTFEDFNLQAVNIRHWGFGHFRRGQRTFSRFMSAAVFKCPKRYTDKLRFDFKDVGNQCEISGCSASQVFSIADFSTNYCNLRMRPGRKVAGTCRDVPIDGGLWSPTYGDFLQHSGWLHGLLRLYTISDDVFFSAFSPILYSFSVI